MADYARVLAAVDKVLSTDGVTRYQAQQGALATDSLTGDDFVAAIAPCIAAGTLDGTFSGTSAQLLAAVTPAGDEAKKWKAPKDWPANARSVTQRLRRQAPVMRKAGWTVDDDDGANHAKAIIWTITPPAPTEKARDEPPRHPQDPHEEPPAGDAGDAGDEYEPSPYDECVCGWGLGTYACTCEERTPA